MRVLWVKAPLVLRHHPPLLAAVVVCAAVAALAASATPFIRAGVASESFRGELRTASPLSAGLEIDVLPPQRLATDAARRAALTWLTRGIHGLGRPVFSSRIPVATPDGLGLFALWRTGAVAHVHRLTSTAGDGVWIADTTANATGVRAGGHLRLAAIGAPGERTRSLTVRVKGTYASLAGDAGNPYWLNWLHDIRSLDPLAPDPPAFVLVPRSLLARLAPTVLNRYEVPVDPTQITAAGAHGLRNRLRTLGTQLTGTAAIGCAVRSRCHASSSLGATITIAAGDVAAVGPTITLLSNCGLLIAIGLAFAAGVFLVRRRADEAHALAVRGEPPTSFGARTMLEALLPALLGGVAGVGVALASLRVFAGRGTIDAATVGDGAGRAAVAMAVSVAAVGAGAGFAFSGWHSRRSLRVPWELVPLLATAALFALVWSESAVTQDASGVSHPRLGVFVLPLAAVIGVTGLVARVARALLRGRAAHAAPAVFLAVRRAAAARGLLVLVIVAAAASFGTFAYASTLRSSLARTTVEKAYVSNGSDVQAYVDPSVRITTPLPFPAAIVELDQSNVAFASGARVDLIAGDPGALARTVLWKQSWGGDPRPLLHRLRARSPDELLAIATPDAPNETAIDDQGARIPIRIVGRARFPGQTAGRPALVVSREALRSWAHRLGILDPGPLTSGLVWAKGDTRTIERALAASTLGATYLTTRDHLLRDPSVAAAARSYRYVEAIGIAAALFSLVGLLLYLQARQRSQLIASAFARRMGLRRRSDVGAVVLEAAFLLCIAAVSGAAVAVATAWPVIGRVDALPQYAPPPVVVVPWLTIVVGVAAAVAAAALAGAAAVTIAARADAGEALRVA